MKNAKKHFNGKINKYMCKHKWELIKEIVTEPNNREFSTNGYPGKKYYKCIEKLCLGYTTLIFQCENPKCSSYPRYLYPY